VRNGLCKTASQNVKQQLLDVFKTNKIAFVATTKPKRSFIGKKGEVAAQGFKIYFQFFSEGDYSKFKTLLFESFQDRFMIKLKKYDNLEDVSAAAGYALLKGIETKKEENQ
jgi:hypothetical protein